MVATNALAYYSKGQITQKRFRPLSQGKGKKRKSKFDIIRLGFHKISEERFLETFLDNF